MAFHRKSGKKNIHTAKIINRGNKRDCKRIERRRIVEEKKARTKDRNKYDEKKKTI